MLCRTAMTEKSLLNIGGFLKDQYVAFNEICPERDKWIVQKLFANFDQKFKCLFLILVFGEIFDFFK
ncbi:MAG: hypothetical protein Q4D17_00870 [Planctomycetia bacterium]|nr:hypothetical protein [Planctomycetia bacterium]